MATFNIYSDKDQQFVYIEKNGVWFMALYNNPEDLIPCPSFDDISMLVKENIREYDCYEDHKITICNECDENGFFYENGEYEICDCYHGQRHGQQWLDNFYENASDNYDDYDNEEYRYND